jgi:hypothetical protein
MSVSDAAKLQYWSHEAAADAACGCAATPANIAECTPLGLYGDDARFNKSGDKLLLIHFNNIIRPQSRRFYAS